MEHHPCFAKNQPRLHKIGKNVVGRMSNVKLSKIEDCNEKEDMLIRLSGRATPEPRVKV